MKTQKITAAKKSVKKALAYRLAIKEAIKTADAANVRMEWGTIQVRRGDAWEAMVDQELKRNYSNNLARFRA